MASTISRAAPVRSVERIQVVDVLRGFAILGILLFNMKSFSGQSFFAGSWEEPLDRAVVILLDFLVQAKFYSLFSFLFGWGMAVQMRRAEDRGAKFLPVYLRRMLVLFFLGALHSIFLWTGDILLMYAVLGSLMALLFRKCSPKVLLLAAFLFLSTRLVLTLPGPLLGSTREWCIGFTRCWTPEAPLPESLYSTGTYWEVTRLRFQETAAGFWWFPCYLGNVFAMMLLGLYAGKRRLFAELDRHQVLLRRVMWVGLSVGVVLNGVFTYASTKPFQSDYYQLIGVGSRTYGAPALTLFYITGITLLFQREKWRERLEPLALVGRMALTNYISHSLLLSFFFYGYGLGLYGRTDPTFGLLLTLLVYRFQIQFSRWWFEHYRFGPLEWLWRTLTYNMRLPLSLKRKFGSLAAAPAGTRRWLPYLLAALLLAGIPLAIFAARKELPQPASAIPGGSPAEETAGEEEEAEETIAEAESTGEASSAFLAAIQDVRSPVSANVDLWMVASGFSPEAAFEHIGILAGAGFQGRYAGTPGGGQAASYIAEKFEQYGLLPLGDSGEYLQAFPLTSLVLDAVPTLTIASPDGNRRAGYLLHQDIVPVLGQYAGAARGEGQVVWAADCSAEDFQELEVVGKIVFCRSGTIPEQVRRTAENGAAGLLLYTDPAAQPPALRTALEEAWIPEPIPVFQIYDSPAADLLAGTGYSISDLSILYEPVVLPASAAMAVEASPSCADPPCSGHNILGLLPGWDPAYADQVIILSASYDGLGSTPDGQLWPGANQNASGTAALLEIARSWQAQGYHPRLSVLFAAWDASLQDFRGIQYFLDHSPFPAENTAAVIHLGGVGSGSSPLQIQAGVLADQAEAAAAAMGLEASQAAVDSGLAGLLPGPTVELSWAGSERLAGLPADSVEGIDPGLLGHAGRVAGTLALQISEIPPAVQELLERRCLAVIEKDLSLFLASATDARGVAEILWFNEIQTLAPLGCEASYDNLRSSLDSARADVAYTIEFPSETSEDALRLTIQTTARFQQVLDGWRWAGPDLTTGETFSAGRTRVTVRYPGGAEESYGQVGPAAIEEYQRITKTLSLPADLDAEILIYPDREALSADTTPSLAARYTEWVGTNTLKFSSNPLQSPGELRASITQLLLQNAGIPRESFPWLWEGLPQLLDPDLGQVVLQSDRLGQFQDQLSSGEAGSSSLSSWAAAAYLQQTRGWAGTGRFLSALGSACRDEGCGTASGADQALRSALGMDLDAFRAAWQEYWLEELEQAQAALDAVLDQRTEAVLSHDEAAFLGTVDPNIPGLLAEEQGWFADLDAYPPAEFQLSGLPVALREDGSILAKVVLQYRLQDGSASGAVASFPLEILFSNQNGELRWAGPLLYAVEDSQIQVLYPAGHEDQASAVLEEAQNLVAQLARELGLSSPPPLTIKIYENVNQYRMSIALSYPTLPWMPGWSAPGQALKLLASSRAADAIEVQLLSWHLGRQILAQTGVGEEWLRSGGSIYLAKNAAGGALQKKAGTSLLTLNSQVLHGQEYSLDEFPELYRLAEDAYWAAAAQAWDAVNYLADRYGEETLMALLQDSGKPQDPDQAFLAATGLSLAEFDAAWKESFIAGHLPQGGLEISLAFDADRASRHIDFLTGPALAGRQAGTEGSSLAAAYIRDEFAAAGLLVEEQIFTIPYQTYLEVPTLTLTIGGSAEAFLFRQDFLVLQAADTAGSLTGELVWVASQDYAGMDLEGKIAIRQPTQAIRAEIENARQRGAAALILVGAKNRPEDLQARYPFPAPGSGSDFPVLELTQDGFARFLQLSGQNRAALSFTHPTLLLDGTGSIEIALSSPTLRETANIIGVLPGKEPGSRDQVVILGAHYDYVGDEFGRRYSGANDNASGVAVLLEIARLWGAAAYQPDCSVLFIAWGAQESGELGSNNYLADPLFPLENTLATIQLDAVGGGDGYYLEAAGSRDVDGALLLSIKKAADAAGTRLMVSGNQEARAVSPDWLFSAGFLFDYFNTAVTSDDLPFRQAGIPTLLLRWKDASENNPPDSLADEVLAERLETSGITASAALMILAR